MESSEIAGPVDPTLFWVEKEFPTDFEAVQSPLRLSNIHKHKPVSQDDRGLPPLLQSFFTFRNVAQLHLRKPRFELADHLVALA